LNIKQTNPHYQQTSNGNHT